MPAWLAPAAIAAGTALMQWLSNRSAARQQDRYNRRLAEFQANANESYLQKQLEYNSPVNQAARWTEAGFNRNLIYGQGNPGNQSAPLTYPDIGRVDLQTLANIGPLLNQTAMTAAQVDATNAKTRHTYAMTQLNQLQQEVLRKNPLLDKEGFRAIINGLRSTAELKAGQAEVQNSMSLWMTGADPGKDRSRGFEKLDAELRLLEQRFNLGTQDQSIKAQILKSKEFQNAILEVQKKFMTDADVTPQHVLQFIQLLLMKIL